MWEYESMEMWKWGNVKMGDDVLAALDDRYEEAVRKRESLIEILWLMHI